jgi:hypothetical protein
LADGVHTLKEDVARSILSIGLAVILVTVVICGSCFACQPGPAPMKAGGCCKGHGKCPMPAQKTHADCGAPALEAFTVEKVSAPDGLLLFVAAPVVAFVPVETSALALDTGRDYSPPDLRILNSCLTI